MLAGFRKRRKSRRMSAASGARHIVTPVEVIRPAGKWRHDLTTPTRPQSLIFLQRVVKRVCFSATLPPPFPWTQKTRQLGRGAAIGRRTAFRGGSLLLWWRHCEFSWFSIGERIGRWLPVGLRRACWDRIIWPWTKIASTAHGRRLLVLNNAHKPCQISVANGHYGSSKAIVSSLLLRQTRALCLWSSVTRWTWNIEWSS